ncbi:MAG: DHH family phosphoesterase [archaeon]
MKGQSAFSRFLSALNGKRVLIVTHSSADIDAISSVGMLYFCLKEFCSPTVVVPERINSYAKCLAENLRIPYSHDESTEFFDAMILTEFNSYDMLGSFAGKAREFKGPKMLIDHHTGSADKIASKEFTVINPESVSNTELLYDLISEAAIPITRQIALLACAGIITDSAGFTVASPHSFEVMAECSRISKKSVQEIIPLFEIPGNSSEKVAKLKAAKRVNIYSIAEFVCATTSVGAFEASSASMLVRIGADVAFACDFEKGNAKVSGRASNDFLKKTGLSLSEIMDSLSKSFEGRGGGHKGAAAFNGKAKGAEEVLSKCVELTLAGIRKKFPSAQMKNHS